MCQSTIYVYMGAKFSSIFRIPWSHQSTSPSYLTFINTVNSLYEPAQPWNTLKIPQKSPPPSLNLNHSLVIDLTLENLTQVSPIVCLSVLYYMSTCAFICTCNTDKQYCCEAMFLRLWATKFCLLCLSVHLCVCLSVSLCLHLFQCCSWLLSHDLTLGNITRGVLLFCLSVCLLVVMITHFVGSPSSPTLSEVFPHHHP